MPSAGSQGDLDLSQTAALVAQARAGDRAAASILFSRYQERLQRFLHARLPSSTRGLLDTQDLLQEVAVRAITALERFEYRGIGSFWAYLRTIARHYLIEVARRSTRRGPTEALPRDTQQVPQAADTTPLEGLLKKEQIEAFERAAERVQEKHREALLLRLELGLSYDVIATECGYPSTDAARMAIRRALGQICKDMSHGESGEK